MPRYIDRTTSFADWAVPVCIFVGPLLEAKRVEARIILANAEAKAEQESQVCNAIFEIGSQLIQLVSPFAKLLRLVEQLVIGKQ